MSTWSKGRKWVWIIIGLAIIGFFMIGILSPEEKKETVNVTYRVDCSNCDVTYFNAIGNPITKEGVSQWRTTVPIESGGDATLSAHNPDGTGAIVVEVWVDYEMVKEDHADGEDVAVISIPID